MKHHYFYMMEAVQKEFSDNVKHLLAAAQKLAIKLGYNYVGSIHFLMADCEAGFPDSPFHVLFENNEAFSTLLKNMTQKKGWSFKPAPAVLPLSQELEDALRLSLAIKQQHNSDVIQPGHIHFASLQNTESGVYKLLAQNEAIISKLYRHYQLQGLFKETPPPEEDPVADKLQYEKILLEINNISKSLSQTHSYAVVLKAATENKYLPVVVGEHEVKQLAVEIEKIKSDRPMVHHLLNAVICATKYNVTEVHINRLVNGVFHSKIIISNNNETHILDARTSDALTLATIAGAPVFTSKAIIDEAGIESGNIIE
jgi:bifunctional DNase/RNase